MRNYIPKCAITKDLPNEEENWILKVPEHWGGGGGVDCATKTIREGSGKPP